MMKIERVSLKDCPHCSQPVGVSMHGGSNFNVALRKFMGASVPLAEPPKYRPRPGVRALTGMFQGWNGDHHRAFGEDE